jgi:hypothetical protein
MALLPYAHSGWMVSLRFSPGHMSSRPSSQPLMTWPLPTVKERGCPRLYEASNSVPVVASALLCWPHRVLQYK